MTQERLTQIPEEAKGMEQHYGFGEYRDLFQQNHIRTGDSVLTFSKLSNGQLTSYRYYAINPETLKQSLDSELPIKARKTLKGLDWFLDSKK